MRTYEFGRELHFPSWFLTAHQKSQLLRPRHRRGKMMKGCSPPRLLTKMFSNTCQNHDATSMFHRSQVVWWASASTSAEPSTAQAQSSLSWPHDRPSSLEALPRPVLLTCCLAIPACPLAWSRHRLQSKTLSGEASWTTSEKKNKRFWRPCADHRAGPCFLEHVGGSRDRAGYHSTR